MAPKTVAEWTMPCDLLHQIASEVLDSQHDLTTIKEAKEHIAQASAKRTRENEETHTMLRNLSLKLEKARQDATRPPNVPSEQEHQQIMMQLDKVKLSTDKGIIETEDMLNTKTEELRRLREELRALESTDPPMEQELDSVALRMRMCNDLGIDIIPGKNKVLVRSPKSNDIHVVSFDDGHDDFYYANRLWDLISS